MKDCCVTLLLVAVRSFFKWISTKFNVTYSGEKKGKELKFFRTHT